MSTMETSYFLAQFLGLMIVIFAGGSLFRPRFLREVAADLGQVSPLVRLFFSFIAIGGGLAIVLTHNLWVADWRVLITIIGWGGLVKGVLALVRPQSLMSAAGLAYGTDARARVSLSIAVLFGLYLAVKGFGWI